MKRTSTSRSSIKLALTLLLLAGASFRCVGSDVIINPGINGTTNTLTISAGSSLTISPTASLTVNLSTFLFAGSGMTNNGTFITGGTVDGSDGIVLAFLGTGVFTSQNARFLLGTTNTFSISGIFDITSGVTFDLTGLSMPNYNGVSIQTGGFPLGTDGSVTGAFDPLTMSVLGLGNPGGATLISEAAGEGLAFNPAVESVYWVQENAGNVRLNYSIAPNAIPEPGTALSLLTGIGLLLGFRRRSSRA